jgi:hypothetical protein
MISAYQLSARKTFIGEWRILAQDIYVYDQHGHRHEFKADARFKRFDTANFGWLAIHPEDAPNAPRRLFKLE